MLYNVLFLVCLTLCNGRVWQPSSKHLQDAQRWTKPKGIIENPVEPPLLMGSFNIQTLGKNKFTNAGIMYIIEKIIQRYDLLLVLEIMTTDMQYMRKLLRDVNEFSPQGVTYNMTMSERHPTSKEFYAIFYRTNKLTLIRTESYNDPEKFYRKPLVAVFSSPTLRDVSKFGVIGHHAKPSNAVQEIDALAGLYDEMAGKYKLQDFLIMGDFNADCSYVGENDWENISLWTRPEFFWLLGNHLDTTTNYKSCALDRAVYAGENLNEGVIMSSAKIFNFQEEYDLNVFETRSVSDHWPIEFKIRGKLSTLAEKHLSSDVCFTVKDSSTRLSILTDSISKIASEALFSVSKSSSGIVMKNQTRDEEAMLSAMQMLNAALPDVITRQLVEAVKYKTFHGSLEDTSSYADVAHTVYKISILVKKDFSSASICRSTSIN
ncbi:deoxyribonuclease-1-like [Uloborus diversus]|uniref:deoxyribonuclease-1-like n=1 Tax=Uloborus diversus TaxID=327109 RepID=UPI0024093BFB|nr:deoxyribonuclease-1-like [Uloborus diversus]